MTPPPDWQAVFNYLQTDAYDGRLPTNDFKRVWDLLVPLLRKLEEASTDRALAYLAYHIDDSQRTWLQRLAQAANQIDDAGMVEEIGEEHYHAQKTPRFGKSNPESMDLAFWKFMVRRRWSAWNAREHFDQAYQAYRRQLAEDSLRTPTDLKTLSEEELLALAEAMPSYDYGSAVWCCQRFGMSITKLPDGREIWIAGEHEDAYDPDFYIYNDVIVVHPDLSIDIYGYPKEVFPPTDFHTATLVGNLIYIIGSLGYLNERRPGETPICRLDCNTFQIEPVPTSGKQPGWIHDHVAEFVAADNAIKVTKGKILLHSKGEHQLEPNLKTYWLDLATGKWSQGVDREDDGRS